MLTVVIVNWNGRQITIDCLNSLFASDYQDMSVVLVDNDSQDGSAEHIAALFPQVDVLRSTANLGYTGGNNLGIAHAMNLLADFVLLLNNDTLVAPTCIATLMAFAEANPLYGVLTPKIYFANPPDHLWFAGGAFSLWRGIPVHRGYRQKDVGQFDVGHNEISFANGCALLVRRAVLEDVGMLDETFFSYAEDVDFTLRLRLAGYRIGFVPNAHLWHRVGYSLRTQKNEAKRYYYYVRNMLYVIAKYAGPLQLFCAIPYFTLHTLLTLGAKSVLRGRVPELHAIWRGAMDFVPMWRNARS